MAKVMEPLSLERAGAVSDARAIKDSPETGMADVGRLDSPSLESREYDVVVDPELTSPEPLRILIPLPDVAMRALRTQRAPQGARLHPRVP